MLAKAAASGQSAKHGESNKWFRDQAAKINKSQTNSVLKDSPDRFRDRIMPGDLMMFYYDPKHKDDLPYYDQWPLIFPLEIKKDRFLGMNMHYLQPSLRAKLFDALHEYTSNTKMDGTTKMKLQYQVLRSAAKFNLVKPTIHMYLKAHVRSRFMKIPAQEWDFALFLPTDRFVKESRTTVWAESRKKAGLS